MPTFTFMSKADVAYAQIRQQILDGTLPAGSKLAQYELAQALDISITPMREAVRRLSGEGWIILDTHRNARVAELDHDAARQIFETRRALEPAAAGLAAQRHTPQDAQDMRAALTALRPVTREWGETALTTHRAVHRSIYRASRNDVMIRMLDDLWDKSDRYRRLGLQLPPDAQARRRDFEEHGAIVDRVLAGDAGAAAELMTSHIDHSLTGTMLAQRAAAAD